VNIENLMNEDIQIFDVTTYGLGIGEYKGKMECIARDDMIICGLDYVIQILNKLSIEFILHAKDGDFVVKNSLILECASNAQNLHYAWKISQNLLEYLSGIATYTHHMLLHARKANPNITIATTRKNFPNTKEMMIKAVLAGGGSVHRLGVYDSILIFKQHLIFLEEKQKLEAHFKQLKTKFIEKKVAVEVDTYEEARYFASLGADVLQCEKMDFDTLKKCVSLKSQYPHLLLSATGGINVQNAYAYAQCGVDFLVTSSPYHAKPLDVQIKISKQKDNQ